MSDGILPLVFADVSYAVGNRRLLDELSFTLEAGSRTVILGPNGSGKSLTLRLAHGLLQPTVGSVEWSGAPASRARRKQAMVFQRPVLLRRTAAANVEFALAAHHVPRGQRRARGARALGKTGLADYAARRARALSAGEQQRLALARAWATEPEVLLLDEPTASLDPAATQAVESLIGSIAEAGAKIVMTTHDLGQARRLADEVLFLHGGRLVEQTPAEEFFRQPASEEARAFVEGRLHW